MNQFEQVQQFLDRCCPGLQPRLIEGTTATVELAAQALGVEVGQIAKTLLFKAKNDYVMVVAAGDVRIDHHKLRGLVGSKTRLARPDEVRLITGYSVGGVCPFNLKQPLRILLDASMDRFPVVYAAAGTANSALPITLPELAQITAGEIVDVIFDREA